MFLRMVISISVKPFLFFKTEVYFIIILLVNYNPSIMVNTGIIIDVNSNKTTPPITVKNSG